MGKKSKCGCNLKKKMYQNGPQQMSVEDIMLSNQQFYNNADFPSSLDSSTFQTYEEMGKDLNSKYPVPKKKKLSLERGMNIAGGVRDLARTAMGFVEDGRVRRLEKDMMYRAMQPQEVMVDDDYRYGLNPQEAFFQLGGDIQGLPAEAAGMANAFVEPNEMVEMQGGGMHVVSHQGETNVDHGDHPSLPGTPLSGVSRVLEATSTKKGRDAAADRVLRINPDQAEALTGFRPKTVLSHATLAKQAMEHYNGKRQRIFNASKNSSKYEYNNARENKTVELNKRHADSLPTDDDIFEIVFQHQEMVKQMFGIDGITNEQKANYKYPVAQYGGDIMQNGPVSNFKDKDDFINYWKQKGSTASDILGTQKFIAGNNFDKLKVYLDTVALNNKGRKVLANRLKANENDSRVKNGKWSDLTPEEVKEAYADGYWSYRGFKMDDPAQSAAEPAQPVENETPRNWTRFGKLPERNFDFPQITQQQTSRLTSQNSTPQQQKRRGVYFPVMDYDLAPANNMYMDSLSRDLEPLVYPERHFIETRHVDPTAAVNQVVRSSRAAARNLGNNPVGYGMRAQMTANADAQINNVQMQSEIQRSQNENSKIQYNAGVRDANSLARSSGILNFNDRVMQGRAKQSLAKQRAIEGRSNVLAANRRFNFNVNMNMPRNFMLDEYGMLVNNETGADLADYGVVYSDPSAVIPDYTSKPARTNRRPVGPVNATDAKGRFQPKSAMVVDANGNPSLQLLNYNR